jgi:flagellar biosynthesis/type III secretory pathway protein FliH
MRSMASIGSPARAHDVYQDRDNQNPVGESPDIEGLARILTEAAGIVQYLQQQAQQLRRRAYLDGYAAGYERAQAETVRQALEAHTVSREFVDSAQQHIVNMALASLESVASRLGSATVVTAMLADALQGIKAERQLKVSVSRYAAKATRSMLARWQGEHPDIEVQVLVDPRLEPFGCEIESELGHITLGLRKRIEVLRDALATEVSVPVANPPAGTVHTAQSS